MRPECVWSTAARFGQENLLSAKLRGSSFLGSCNSSPGHAVLGWGNQNKGLCVSTQTAQMHNIVSGLASKGNTF